MYLLAAGLRHKLPNMGKRSIECRDGFLPVCLRAYNYLEDLESIDEDGDSNRSGDDDNVVGQDRAV
jgi:hypothetical protein